ncbi:YheC/YheD family protein [Heyndrickxia sporothermodurans]
MKNAYKIVPVSYNGHCIMFHPNQNNIIGKTMSTSTISFGSKNMEVLCKQLNTLKENEIGVSKTIIENLQLPLDVDYEISFQNNHIIIGPFIGMLIANSNSDLHKKVKYYTRMIKQYPLVKGVIVLLSWEGIDQKSHMINGYFYNPILQNWETGTFPFPTVIVKQTVLSTKKQNYLKNILGQRFFNSAYINKWRMHQLLSSNTDLLPHLPHTFLYEHPNDILQYLNRFGTIYVKSVMGLKGNSVEKFIRKPDKYSVKYRHNNENKTIDFFSEEALLNYAEYKFKSNKYIIQKEIDIEIEKGHLIDFRIVLIKDQEGQWKDVGMIGRTGVTGSVVSNRSSGGQVELGESLLLTAYHLSKEEMLSLRQKMSEIAITAAKEIDKYESIYKHGVDIGIDRNLHIWLIEINNNSPNDNIFSYIGDHDKVSKIKDAYLFYAKYLAGFPDKEGNASL